MMNRRRSRKSEHLTEKEVQLIMSFISKVFEKLSNQVLYTVLAEEHGVPVGLIRKLLTPSPALEKALRKYQRSALKDLDEEDKEKWNAC